MLQTPCDSHISFIVINEFLVHFCFHFLSIRARDRLSYLKSKSKAESSSFRSRDYRDSVLNCKQKIKNNCKKVYFIKRGSLKIHFLDNDTHKKRLNMNSKILKRRIFRDPEDRGYFPENSNGFNQFEENLPGFGTVKFTKKDLLPGA